MKIKAELTAKKLVPGLCWIVVGLVNLGALGFAVYLGNSSGAEESLETAIIIWGVAIVAVQHFYLFLVPILVVWLGMAHDAKAGKSTAFSFWRWLLAGSALYIVALCGVIWLL